MLSALGRCCGHLVLLIEHRHRASAYECRQVHSSLRRSVSSHDLRLPIHVLTTRDQLAPIFETFLTEKHPRPIFELYATSTSLQKFKWAKISSL